MTDEPPLALSEKELNDRSLEELRKLALKASSKQANARQVTTETKARAGAIKLYALKRANGKCEGCGDPAPFQTKKGPYLEVHHIHRVSDGGPDSPENVIALCPTCHRRVHNALDGVEYNAKLEKKAETIESEMAHRAI